jgi:YVTN family beta-propeller protein
MKFRSRTAFSRTAAQSHLVLGMLTCALTTLALPALAQSDAPGGSLINPQAIVFNPATEKVYAVDTSHGAIVVYNRESSQAHRVAVGKGPVSIAVNTATGRAYVTNVTDGTVSVLDGATDAVLATVPVGDLPYSIAANSVTNKVYVTHTYSGETSILDGATNTITNVKTGSMDLVALSEATNTVFLLGYEGGTVTLLDGASLAMQKREAGKHAWGMIFNDGTGKLYVPRLGMGSVAVFDGSSTKPGILPAGHTPCALVVNAKANMAYIVNYEGNNLSVVDIAKSRVVATVPVGERPQAVAFDAKLNLVFVANTLGDSVTVIDAATYKVLATRATGKRPNALAVNPGLGRLYVANEAGDSASTIVDLSGIRKTAR